jgi:sugar lactone lactonase YvrE
MRIVLRLLLAVGIVLALGVAGIWARYGGGGDFPDRAGPGLLTGDVLETLAELPRPPGNVAVSADGRVFFTFHPQAARELAVVEWVEGEARPYPSAETEYREVLSVRIDRQNRLWALDAGGNGFGQPRILAFDLADGREVHRYDFPREVAGRGSHLNDFQVSPDGRWIFIADASIFAKTPALVVYDVAGRASWRALENHDSVDADRYVPVVQGRRMLLLGIFAVRPGVDSIALDRQGEWLYFAPITDTHMYRVHTRDLIDRNLAGEGVAARVERYAPKTMSDGISTDVAGNVYLTDLEHDAVVVLGPDRELTTIVRDPRLRWPDGLSFGPDGYLYVTCSALHHVIGMDEEHLRSQAPYQIYRFRPPTADPAAEIPGH